MRSVYTARHEHRVIKASYDTDNARQSTDLRPASLLTGALNADEQVRRGRARRARSPQRGMLDLKAHLQSPRI